jgi:hypothetical protein
MLVDAAELSHQSPPVAPHHVLEGDELLFLASIHDLLVLSDRLVRLGGEQRNPVLSDLARSVLLRVEYLACHSGLTQSRRRVLLRQLRDRGVLPRHVDLP